jgi:hypothetical protein
MENNMNKPIQFASLLVIISSVILTACGTNSQTPASCSVSNSISSNNSEIGGEGGVEAALVIYSDATQGFAIGHPGTWSQDTTFTNGVKFIGGDDWMTLEFASLAAGTDAMTYVKGDVAVISSQYAGFKQIGTINASTEVKNAIILGFNSDGVSTVTGKNFTAHNERYYMPLSDGRIAILTVYGPENHYDREGVRDIALTFKLTK